MGAASASSFTMPTAENAGRREQEELTYRHLDGV
jgi:hypothetical protein